MIFGLRPTPLSFFLFQPRLTGGCQPPFPHIWLSYNGNRTFAPPSSLKGPFFFDFFCPPLIPPGLFHLTPGRRNEIFSANAKPAPFRFCLDDRLLPSRPRGPPQAILTILSRMHFPPLLYHSCPPESRAVSLRKFENFLCLLAPSSCRSTHRSMDFHS